jgi:hypothetical protein
MLNSVRTEFDRANEAISIWPVCVRIHGHVLTLVDHTFVRGYTEFRLCSSWALSSGGESAPLIRVRSVVRVHEGPPFWTHPRF